MKSIDPRDAAELSPEVESRLRSALADAVLAAAAQNDDGTDEGFALRLITAAQISCAVAEATLKSSVEAGRRSRLSWDVIGQTLGITRQAAWSRFGQPSEVPTPAGERRVISGVHSLSEMSILRREGESGHRLVDAGMNYLVVEPSGQHWEHRRTLILLGGTARRRLIDEGWVHVLDVWPFSYFARPS